jgi:hypothetical protein
MSARSRQLLDRHERRQNGSAKGVKAVSPGRTCSASLLAQRRTGAPEYLRQPL